MPAIVSVRYVDRGAVAQIVIAHPPVNALGFGVRRSIIAALDRANDDPSVRAIVLSAEGRLFSAGADIAEFASGAALIEPTLRTVLQVIDTSKKPVIAAMHGKCLGGGFELALACHYRVALADTVVAFPEIKLGLIPGAGGTQRLPRAIGVERALGMILNGSPEKLADIATGNLVHAIVETDVGEAAISFAASLPNQAPNGLSAVELSAVDVEGFLQFARSSLAATGSGASAQIACVDALAASAGTPFGTGLAVEYRLFLELLESAQSKALRHAFMAERAALHVPDLPARTKPAPIASIGIAGGGTMGCGIAIVFLSAGLPVTLLEVNQTSSDRAVSQIHAHFQNALDRNRLSATEHGRALSLLHTVSRHEDLADCDLIIEAIFEDLTAKLELFGKLGAVMKPDAILASNTSMLDINVLADASGRAQSVLGMHFFSPAPVMRLVEVIRGQQTSPVVLSSAIAVARQVGKIPVVTGVCDGFIGNRMLEPYLTQAMALVEEGASPAQIDAALERFGMAMGPFRMCDLAGNDVGWSHRRRRYNEYPDMRRARVADVLCEQGRFGQKAGLGWYRYGVDRRKAIADPDVDAIISSVRDELGIRARTIGEEEIVDRCILALVNEGARLLDEGIAIRSSDIDVVYTAGYGFPRTRGGPMFYADQLGLFNVIRRMNDFTKNPQADPRFWEPAPLLKRLDAERLTFALAPDGNASKGLQHG